MAAPGQNGKAPGGYDAPPPYSPEYQQYNVAPQYPQQTAYPAPPPGWAPPQGWAPPPGPAPATQGPAVVIQPTVTQPATRVVILGGCPTCHAGVLEDSYGFCAIFLAIFFFPIGILCCLAMRDRRCSHCGAHFN